MSGMGFDGSTPEMMFEYRNLNWDTFTDLAIDPIVINTWYTALVPTDDVKAYYLIVSQTNNGATNENLEVELTINGIVVTAVVAGWVSGTAYYLFFDRAGALQTTDSVRQMLALDFDQSAPLETRDLQIRVRQTSAVDAVAAQIDVNMVYETLEVT